MVRSPAQSEDESAIRWRARTGMECFLSRLDQFAMAMTDWKSP